MEQPNVILVTEGRSSLLRICLEIAVKRFREDARECRTIGQAGERLAQQFDRQALQAEELLASFCEGDSLRIEVVG